MNIYGSELPTLQCEDSRFFCGLSPELKIRTLWADFCHWLSAWWLERAVTLQWIVAQILAPGTVSFRILLASALHRLLDAVSQANTEQHHNFRWLVSASAPMCYVSVRPHTFSEINWTVGCVHQFSNDSHHAGYWLVPAQSPL